ncbi:MAG: glycosyltransferase [Acetobacteraceae bacterium]|nr:glycosyltransferase [Acetobacteraceae bacterium]
MIQIPDPLSLDRCVVCVPARNEAVALPRLVAALARQELCRDGGRLRLVVAANNCTDGTVPVLRGLATRYPALRLHVLELSLPPETAHVGVARARAMAEGAAWLREEGVEDGILLGTDADTRPPPHWVAANLAALAGADCVGGRIVIEDSGENPAPGWLRMMRERVDAYWSAVRELAHAIDPLPHDPPPRHGGRWGRTTRWSRRWSVRAGGCATRRMSGSRFPPGRRGAPAAAWRARCAAGACWPRAARRISCRGRASGGGPSGAAASCAGPSIGEAGPRMRRGWACRRRCWHGWRWKAPTTSPSWPVRSPCCRPCRPRRRRSRPPPGRWRP